MKIIQTIVLGLFLLLTILAFSQRPLAVPVEDQPLELIKDGFEFAYDINGKIYYPEGDTLTVVLLAPEYNYMVASVRVIPPSPAIKEVAYIEDSEFQIPMKWDQRRIDRNRIIYHFYPEEWHIEKWNYIPIEDRDIIIYVTNMETGEKSFRILYLKIVVNNKPIIKNQYYNYNTY